uniref:Heme-binding protein 2 n=1 Tax=Dicentrarchus labrax TaxID=13489 RepID=A0A8P4KHZ9_DICLA
LKCNKMEQPLVLLVSLVLVSFCRGQDFCNQKLCPQYKLIEKNQDFEKRLYVATDWITTKIESTVATDLMTARSRLIEYCKRENDAGFTIPVDTWPVLITVTEDQDLWLSWFVPPSTTKPQNIDTSVTLQSKPEAIVYVRVFGGTPSIQSGQDNANTLWKALDKNCTDLPTYSGAGYDSYFSVTHHNEIWIYDDDICKKTM